MELQQLKTFTTIAKTGSFTKAAEIFDYAQSSISAQIAVWKMNLPRNSLKDWAVK